MLIKKYFIPIFLLLGIFSASAQTIGVTQSEESSLKGYTFFSPFSGTKAYLVDHCGRLINQWDRGTRPGLSAYFLENGLMLRTYKVDPVGPFTSASNAGGLELVDWDNNTVWSWELNTETQLSHHDAVYMPNGNILTLTWELVYTDEIIEFGRDPNEIATEGYMWSERILELEPTGSSGANIVWEWNIKNHYIQDFDASKLNFGVVSEHPELFNVNLPELNSSNSNSTRDWNHFNAIDYHPELDQILISTRNSDEIWIIDHSTTTAEAASHSGGLSGKGGDLLYRWGNPAAYDRGVTGDQQLFGQHGIQWIKQGFEDVGKIIIFNNGNGRPGPDFSMGQMVLPPLQSNFNYTINDGEVFGPVEAETIYGDQSGEMFYSPYLSNAQRLPNKHTLLNSGSNGTIFEIDADRNIVWEYIIPLFGDFPGNQGQSVNNNATFRAYKFLDDYSGLADKDLSPGNTIEVGDNPLGCTLLAVETIEPLNIDAYYDPTQSAIVIKNPEQLKLTMLLYDRLGQQYRRLNLSSDSKVLDVTNLSAGIYFLQIQGEDGRRKGFKIPVF